MRIIEATRGSAVGIGPERSVAEAARVMERSGIGALVVLEDGAVVGIVTDRDLVRRVLACGRPADGRVDGVMTTPVVTVDADADVRDAVALFGTHAVRRLPVVADGRFVGMFTLDDALVEVAQTLGQLARPVTAELLFAHHDPLPPAVVTASS